MALKDTRIQDSCQLKFQELVHVFQRFFFMREQCIDSKRREDNRDTEVDSQDHERSGLWCRNTY